MPVKSVPLRKLGKNGPNIPALGLGLMGMSAGIYGTPPNDEERFKLLDRAAELGETFWDTADIYGGNEELLGKWFKHSGKRDSIFLATKFGILMDGMQFKGINSSSEYCRQQCEASLKKLGTDRIDLYFAHRVHPETPIEETMRALSKLKAEGKIKHIGLCEVSSATLRRAYKIAPVAAVQMEYSPFVLEIERESGTNLLDTCRELGVAIVCSSPLGRGLLTGAFMNRESITGADDIRGSYFPWFSEEHMDANAKLVSQFKAFADKKGCTPTQLAIAWILKQGDDFFPIPGTKKIRYLEQNWGSLDINLSDNEEAEIRKFVDSAEVSGYRSTPGSQAFAFVDTKEEA
ncbi:putative aldo/keto reductase [Lindgomyces ingoldianus]|uniref:Aldo/keto reductase n=1 Tax=Lindgomyces ingoldianus TaxID=673940 RepID=A0ACB6QVW5_9PLEO|nr:putative aldo/keto reductase [Lindgomyces ingoldianus]KAF2470427.1 putative aldo/keto reductase [Lindgomyces ingoldianus]